MHQELTRKNVSTFINTAVIIVVISKQPSVMTLLDHYKGNWRLVIGLQGRTGLFPKIQEDNQKKVEEFQIMLLSKCAYPSNGIKFIQQDLIELSLTDAVPEIEKFLVYR